MTPEYSDRVEKPLASWTGKETHNGEIIDCLTIIFKSGGCSWNRCKMCGYKSERYHNISCDGLTENIKRQLAYVLSEYKIEKFPLIKIFTSGSFFDSNEVPPRQGTQSGRHSAAKPSSPNPEPSMSNPTSLKDFGR